MNERRSIKHIIIGEEAFTEDKILIYKLLVYDLPKGASATNIMDYFKTFGRITYVRMLMNLKKAFLCVHEPKVAVKILQENCHLFMDSIIRVEPCHSLHQPDGEKLIDMLNEIDKMNSATEGENIDEFLNTANTEAPIFNLNDDCLESICKKLSLEDRLNFALTCPRFYGVVLMLSKVEHVTLNTKLFKEWTIWKIRIYVQILGPQVKKLKTSWSYGDNYWDSEIIKLLASFCTNVKKLKVYYSHPAISIRKLIKNMHSLQELELFDIGLSNRIMKFVKTNTDLKYLSITNNADVTGKNIHLFSNLEKLSLIGCSNISSWHFRDICKHLNKLSYLDIRDCDFMKTEDYVHISKHLVQLGTLKFSSTKGNFTCIGHLPNLKSLAICTNIKNDHTVDLLNHLAAHRANQLEELKLYDLNTFTCLYLKIAGSVAQFKRLKVLYCSYRSLEDRIYDILSNLTELIDVELTDCDVITNEILVYFFIKCRKLERIVLHNSHLVTQNFLNNAIQILREQHLNWLRTKRVHIEVNPYKCICKHITKETFSDLLSINCVPRVQNSQYEEDIYYDGLEDDAWQNSFYLDHFAA